MKTNPVDNIILVGGGLAGLICALHLQKQGLKTTLIEKKTYPHHKVCGEYISNEVLPYLQWLDVDPYFLNPSSIKNLSVSSNIGKIINCKLSLGGFGLSRFSLDHFLYQKALQKGCNIITDRVEYINFRNDHFEVGTGQHGLLNSSVVIGAYGKRSALDHMLTRSFMMKKSPILAVKAHFTGDFPEDLVALHNFKGGYCGISKVENNLLNICYLADYTLFKAHKDIAEFQQKVLYKNPNLERIFETSAMVFKQPLTISQVSFARKKAVEDHILMIGDTAGLIHPLCGNGMAMAIHSAKLCAESIIAYSNGSIGTRDELEKKYIKLWNSNFRTRLRAGEILSGLISGGKAFDIMQQLLIEFPSALPAIVKLTHGKPLVCQ